MLIIKNLTLEPVIKHCSDDEHVSAHAELANLLKADETGWRQIQAGFPAARG